MNRYGWQNPETLEALEEERLNVRIAEMICDFRQEAGLTQQQLAQKARIPRLGREAQSIRIIVAQGPDKMSMRIVVCDVSLKTSYKGKNRKF